MCGITGIVNFDNSKKVDETLLKIMTDSIVHRGPDDEGYYIENNVGLGFRRLSIIDLSTGHQPLSNEDNSIWIVFNGEIYNYQVLKKELINLGHIFKTNTDTEVIVHLYEQFGEECFQYMRGMFGLAIYDSRKNKILCARDRFGKKPLYYYCDDKKFIFGSELQTITKHKDILKEINSHAIDDYFAYGYILGDKSIYKNIKKLKPAHFLEIDLSSNKIQVQSYWDIKYEPDYSKSEKDWEEEIVASLSESVKIRMISDVPLGAFLSGGIDSSSVVALMAKQSSDRIKTFSIGFKEPQYNETDYAREVAKLYNTEHYEQIVEPESINLLPKLVSAYAEPFADPSSIPTYYVSKFAREHVTVVLSGDGGDELFAGYNAYSRLNFVRKLQVLPDKINQFAFSPIFRIFPYSFRSKKAFYYLSKKSKYLGAYYSIWNENERRELYKTNILDSLANYYAEDYKIELLNKFKNQDFITDLQELDLRTYLVDDVLTKVDRASMMNSLEVRVPLLDHKFAELAFRIPSNLKFHNNTKKYIFKLAMQSYLPSNVFSHKKQGFGIPLNLWFRNDLNTYIQDRLLDKNAKVFEYLNYYEISKILKRNQYGDRNLGTHLWSILFLDAWLENSHKS